MGRRKISIAPISDDRNRSVTFLKRKNGLFKKAYELGILCSAEVAVVVFSNTGKLFEFSSCDMDSMLLRYSHYSGAQHEKRGPHDFASKDVDNITAKGLGGKMTSLSDREEEEDDLEEEEEEEEASSEDDGGRRKTKKGKGKAVSASAKGKKSKKEAGAGERRESAASTSRRTDSSTNNSPRLNRTDLPSPTGLHHNLLNRPPSPNANYHPNAAYPNQIPPTFNPYYAASPQLTHQQQQQHQLHHAQAQAQLQAQAIAQAQGRGSSHQIPQQQQQMMGANPWGYQTPAGGRPHPLSGMSQPPPPPSIQHQQQQQQGHWAQPTPPTTSLQQQQWGLNGTSAPSGSQSGSPYLPQSSSRQQQQQQQHHNEMMNLQNTYNQHSSSHPSSAPQGYYSQEPPSGAPSHLQQQQQGQHFSLPPHLQQHSQSQASQQMYLPSHTAYPYGPSASEQDVSRRSSHSSTTSLTNGNPGTGSGGGQMNYEDQQMGSVVPTRSGSRESIRSDTMAEAGVAGRKGLLSRTDSGNKPRLSVSIPGLGMGEERGGNIVIMSNGEERVKDEPEGMEEDLDEDDQSLRATNAADLLPSPSAFLNDVIYSGYSLSGLNTAVEMANKEEALSRAARLEEEQARGEGGGRSSVFSWPTKDDRDKLSLKEEELEGSETGEILPTSRQRGGGGGRMTLSEDEGEITPIAPPVQRSHPSTSTLDPPQRDCTPKPNLGGSTGSGPAPALNQQEAPDIYADVNGEIRCRVIIAGPGTGAGAGAGAVNLKRGNEEMPESPVTALGIERRKSARSSSSSEGEEEEMIKKSRMRLN